MAFCRSGCRRRPRCLSSLMDTKGAKESVRIKRVEFRENVRAYFHQGQGIRSVIKRCLSVLSGCP